MSARRTQGPPLSLPGNFRTGTCEQSCILQRVAHPPTIQDRVCAPHELISFLRIVWLMSRTRKGWSFQQVCLYGLLALVVIILSLPFILLVLFYLVAIPPLMTLINLIFPISWFISPETARNCLNGLINGIRFFLGASATAFRNAKEDIA